MAICEDCGVTFDPPAEPSEVTSARILCMNCEARRLMAKASKSKQAPRGSVSDKGVTEAPRQAARPAAPPRAAAGGSSSVGVKTAAKQKELAPVKPLPSKAGRGETGRPAAAVKARILVENEGSKVVFYGWIAAGALTVIGLGIALWVKSVKDAEAARFQAYKDEKKAFGEEMLKYDLSKREDAQRAIARAEEKRDLWKGTEIAADVQSQAARAHVQLELMKEREELTSSLAQLDAITKDPGSRSTEELSTTRRKLKELEPRANTAGPEFAERLKQSIVDVNRAYAIKLRDEARSAAAGGAKGKPALLAYAKAEDELVTMYGAAHTEKNPQALEFLKGLLTELWKEHDNLAALLLTDDYVKSIQNWKDLLSGEQAKNWMAPKISGFEHRIENGVLQVVGPDEATKRTGSITIGDSEIRDGRRIAAPGYRHFQLQIEFVVEKGRPSLVLRAGNPIDPKHNEMFSIEPESSGIEVGKTAKFDITFVGNKLKVAIPDSETPPYTVISDVNKIRKGAIGFIVPDGTKFKVTKLRIKELP